MIADEYPVKEVLIEKRIQTRVFVRANNNEEALKKAKQLANDGKVTYDDDPYYETEIYEEYKEGIINENFIEKI